MPAWPRWCYDRCMHVLYTIDDFHMQFAIDIIIISILNVQFSISVQATVQLASCVSYNLHVLVATYVMKAGQEY